MRRAHAGQFYEPVPTNVDHGDILEEENEKMTALLRDKIHDLKAVTLEIGNEVKYQEKLLNHMEPIKVPVVGGNRILVQVEASCFIRKS
ncbi:uncharacterized protein LOC126184624 isoform X2 [Schistocerca cancellata]|uniref:uncharacterized protein LOC126184624 isoform X2 n=1 Tax=Schistocerca cancellata TaxID=274614 RepID=UPI0021181999|nr:uncharacterized protein LOC126184624 isoform X2 [Schistocerca cancellata]